MGLLSSERGDLSKIGSCTIVLALTFAVMSAADQTTPSTQPPPAPAVQKEHTPEALPTVEGAETADHTAIDVEIQRRFNDLRRERLDDKADTINWWLNIILIVLGFFSVVAAVGVYLGLSGLREIKDEAKASAEEVKKSAEEIKGLKKQAEEDALQIEQERERIARTNVYYVDPDQAKRTERASQEVRPKPTMSPLDRAINEAFSLQQAGKIEEAIEKWRSIANVVEGSDPDLAAHAWFSVGYLLYKTEVEDVGEQ